MALHDILQIIADVLIACGVALGGHHSIRRFISDRKNKEKKLSRKEMMKEISKLKNALDKKEDVDKKVSSLY